MNKKFKLLLRLIAGLPKTLYVNFKVLPVSQAIHLPLFVSCHTQLGELSRNSIRIEAPKVSFAMISFGVFERSEGLLCVKKCYLSVGDKSSLVFRGRFALSQGSCLKVSNGATMICGDKVTFNVRARILCSYKVEIGNNVRLGWDCTVKDADGHAISDEDGKIINNARPVIVGSNVWAGAEVALLKGAVIPNGCVVGFRSVVTKKYEQENAIIAGAPAKILKENIKWLSD